MNQQVRQERFIHEYLLSGNAASAARIAGYSERSARVTGSRLLTKANIKADIEIKRLELIRDLRLEREDVVRGLMEAARIAKENRDPNAMISAMAEISRMMGFYSSE